MVTVSKQECFGLERIGIFPIIDSLDRLPYLRLSLPLKPGFHMIVGDRSRSLGSLVKCSAIVTIIWKPNFHFASDRQRSQRLPTIATTMIAGIESESISTIVAIVSDRKKLMETTSAATAAIGNDHMETRLYKNIIKPPANSIKKAILNI